MAVSVTNLPFFSEAIGPAIAFAPSLPNVRPGDVITAGFMNTLVAAVKALEARVTALEAEAAVPKTVLITSIGPTTIRVGSVMKVSGANFATPAKDNIVTVKGFPVTSFRTDSSRELLFFTVPNIGKVANNGSSVPLSVSNGKGSAAVNITVLPPAKGGTAIDQTVPVLT